MSDLSRSGPGETTRAAVSIIVRRSKRFELALTKPQQLALRWLAARGGCRVSESELGIIAYGLFSTAPGRLTVRDDVSRLELLLSRIAGARAIHVGDDRSYALENSAFEIVLAE